MKHINKLFKKSILCASVGLLFVPAVAVSLASCGEQAIEKIDSISLSAEQNYIFVGEDLQIEKTISPASARNNQIEWKVITEDRHISISQSGLLHVDNDYVADEPREIVVQASDPTQETVFNVIPIVVAKKTSSNVIGFLNSDVTYWDRYIQPSTVKIVRKGLSEFETVTPVDLFAMDQVGNDISFTPIFKSRVNKQMKFHIVGYDGSDDRGLGWEDYQDNSWTTTIPQIKATKPYIQNNTIEVRFACDAQLVFRINCFVWNRRGAVSHSRSSYTKDTKSTDQHAVSYIGESGKYKTSMFYTSPGKEGHQDTISGTINFFKPLYEYLDLNFSIDFKQLKVADAIKIIMIDQGVEDIPKQIKKVERSEYDQFPMLQLTKLTLDFSNPYFNPERFGHNPVPLFTLVAKDPIQSEESISLTLDFYLDWNE